MGCGNQKDQIIRKYNSKHEGKALSIEEGKAREVALEEPFASMMSNLEIKCECSQ